MYEEIAERVVVPLVIGAVGGAVRSFAGYLDAKRKNKKIKWSWSKAFQSLGRGAASGFALSLAGLGGVGGLVEYFVTFVGGMSGDVLAHDLGLKK